MYYNEGAGPVSVYFFSFFSVQPPEGRIEESGEMRSNERRKGEEMGGGGGRGERMKCDGEVTTKNYYLIRELRLLVRRHTRTGR